MIQLANCAYQLLQNSRHCNTCLVHIVMTELSSTIVENEFFFQFLLFKSAEFR